MEEKPYLTVKEFHKEVHKRQTKKRDLIEFFKNINKNYTIPVTEEVNKTECPPEYPESYIVNESKNRFKTEIKQSHFLSHWGDLCKFPEVSSQLRFVYNLINLKKELLIILLDQITTRLLDQNTILESNENSNSVNKSYFNKIINFLGLTNNEIARIKIDNQSSKPKKQKSTKKNDTHNNSDKKNDNNNDSINDSETSSNMINKNHSVLNIHNKYNRKMVINFTIILNLEEEYPRNLLSCPVDKVVLGERHKHLKNRTLNFLCHKDNMIERLKTNKLCLSVWLLKTQKKKNWTTSIKMGTAYLSDTFPGEKGTVNDFIKDILNMSSKNDSAIFLNKIDEAIKNNYFYAIEANELNLNPNSNLKNKKTNTHVERVKRKTKKKLNSKI